MPTFCDCGADKYICQACGRDLCSADYPPEWRKDITKREHAGNVCPECVAKYDTHEPMSLYDHCKMESGFDNPAKVTEYMNRYYGHG